jgi:predicted nucleotidyltransferase
MRLTQQQTKQIAELVQDFVGHQVSIYVFGSRLNDKARGGDLDIMLDFSDPVENPALLSATLSAKISRMMHGRKVDVLLNAPNLTHLPIHDIALNEGQRL